MPDPTPAGAAPRDEARDINEGAMTDSILSSAATYPTEYVVGLHGDPLWEAIWAAIKPWDIEREPGFGYAHATGDDVTRIYDAVLAAAPRADPYEAALRQLSATFQTRWDGGANGLERSIWCEAKVNVDEAIRAAARAPGREP